MKQKYSVESLHPIRHMEEYIHEVEAGSVSPYRAKQLKERFADVKKISGEMYKDSYNLIIQLDGEIPGNPELLWKHDLETAKAFSGERFSTEEYSEENLHPIRHFAEYCDEVKNGDISKDRIITLKNRLGVVMRLSVKLYYDAERIIRLLD